MTRLRRGGRGLAIGIVDLALVLFVASLLTYSLVLLAPGDAAIGVAVDRAGPGASAEQIEQVREELGLDEGTGPVQYARWLGRVLQGDLGSSARTGQPVDAELLERLPVTLVLVTLAAALALPLGLAMGIAGAVLAGGAVRGGLRLGALLGVSLPPFWVSYLLIIVFAEYLGLLPTSGQAGPETYVMPVIVLALLPAGTLSRVVAVTLREALDQPYVVAARARGATPWSIVARDALPNAAGPILSTAGFLGGGILTGTLVVEAVFSWSGIGDYFVQAVSFRDIPAVQGCVLVFATGFIAANRLADRAHAAIDPRVALRGAD